MPPGNPTHLLKLADREFRHLTEERPRLATARPHSNRHECGTPVPRSRPLAGSAWPEFQGLDGQAVERLLSRPTLKHT